MYMDKKCSYFGQIFIKQDEKQFKFYPSTGNRQLAVYYDITKDDFEDENLSLKIERGDSKGSSSVLMKLKRTDYLFNEEEIFQINLDTASLSLDLLSEVATSFEKTLQVFGEYKLSSNGGVIEAAFNYEDGSVISVITNLESTVLEVFQWLCDIWHSNIKYTQICISIQDSIIEDSHTFMAYGDCSLVNVHIAEKCYANPVTEDDSSIILAWDKDGCKLIGNLSKALNVDKCLIKLINKDDEVINESEQLIKEQFRFSDCATPRIIRYDVVGTKLKCMSMKDNTNSQEVMILENQNVSEVKRKLGFKLKVEAKRLIICSNDKLLSDDEEISCGEELKYLVGLSQDNILSKKTVGKGGFGLVYKCVDSLSNETFALKEFIIPSDETTKCTIVRELMVMLTVVHHVNLVRYLDIYVNNNDICIAMEYLEGGSLKDYITGPLNEKEIRNFSKDILMGLNHLHTNKASHRDIKADNVLLGRNNIAKLCDFGLSKILTDFSRTELYKDRTQTGECGTYRWMAPEVIDSGKYGFKADIWSVGATVIQMITGNVPYYGYEEMAALYKIANTKTIQYNIPNDMSTSLKEFVDACIQSNPTDRLTCEQLLQLPFFND